MSNEVEIASLSAESLILGRMINSSQDRKTCCENVKDFHFFYPEHKILFEVLSQFQQQNKPSEIQLLLEHLKDKNLLEKVKGIDYIMSLAQTAPSPIHIPSYINILKDNWVKRQTIEEIKTFSKELSSSKNISDCLDSFSKRFNNLSKDLLKASALSMAEISALQGKSGYLAELSYRREYYQKHKKPFIDGVSTGYPDLDAKIGGLGNSNLIIIASRPGMGKTAFSLNLVQRISQKYPVGIISLEMSSLQLYERMLSTQCEIAGDRIREGKTNEEEWKRINNEEPLLSRLPIFIQEGSSFLNELITKTRYLKEEKGIKVLFIDYLQLIRASGETRLSEVSNITRDLKNLAIELHLPIVCLAQLSRKVEERNNHRPLLSDLRESGTIEQDADIVLFLLRPEYYNEEDRPGETDLIVAKNRHGKTGKITLYFEKKFARFESLLTTQKHEIF